MIDIKRTHECIRDALVSVYSINVNVYSINVNVYLIKFSIYNALLLDKFLIYNTLLLMYLNSKQSNKDLYFMGYN